jgi:hypothetical protein
MFSWFAIISLGLTRATVYDYYVATTVNQYQGGWSFGSRNVCQDEVVAFRDELDHHLTVAASNQSIVSGVADANTEAYPCPWGGVSHPVAANHLHHLAKADLWTVS